MSSASNSSHKVAKNVIVPPVCSIVEILSDSTSSDDEGLIEIPKKKYKPEIDNQIATEQSIGVYNIANTKEQVSEEILTSSDICHHQNAQKNPEYERDDREVVEMYRHEKIEELSQNVVGKRRKIAKNISSAPKNKIIKDKTKNEIKRQLSSEEKQLEKNVKKVLKSTNKEECVKNIMVVINENILEQEYGNTIKETLKTNKISFKSTNIYHNFITWTRKIQTIENMCLKETDSKENHAVYIMSATKFSNLISEKALCTYIQEKVVEIKCQHITIIIYGAHKSTEKQEQAILELEMFIKCHFQFIQAVEPLAQFILMITKAVALIPYKLANEEKYKSQNIYLNEYKKDCVRVDQNGNGLERLWHQMLTMFPLARLETAEAITTAYPTPSALFKSYNSTGEKETMLQSIDVRRAQGPLTANRRIGPEMSKRVCNYFTSSNNKIL